MTNLSETINTLSGATLSGVTNKHSLFSQDYLDWVHQANLPPLTSLQHRFAEWLLEPENIKMINQIGNLDVIFLSIKKWLKMK